MKFSTAFLALATLAATAQAANVQLESSVKTFSSPNWKVGARVGNSDTVDLFVVLKHEKAQLAALEKQLYAVSDPSSPDYGKHLTIDEVKAVLDLPEHHTSTVLDHLSTYKVERIEANK